MDDSAPQVDAVLITPISVLPVALAMLCLLMALAVLIPIMLMRMLPRFHILPARASNSAATETCLTVLLHGHFDVQVIDKQGHRAVDRENSSGNGPPRTRRMTHMQ